MPGGRIRGYLTYWGKSAAPNGITYHLLPYHCFDVAAVAWAWLEADRLLRRRLARLTGWPEAGVAPLLAFLAGIHDLGKFSPGFQALVAELCRHLHGTGFTNHLRRPHPQLSALAGEQIVARLWREQGWFGSQGLIVEDEYEWGEFLGAWQPAWAFHHGWPLGGDNLPLKSAFPPPHDQAVAEFCADLAGQLGGHEPWLRGWEPYAHAGGVRRASWLIAGLIVAADWLASNEAHFTWEPSPLPLAEYWPRALKQARDALKGSGLLPARPAAFQGVGALFPHIERPRPLQAWAGTTPLAPGPQLFILEDQTGSGKTEAALVLGLRFMEAGQAQGIYFGLPTMATANAMYQRLEDEGVLTRLFQPLPRPSLALVHSRARFHAWYDNAMGQAPSPGQKEAYGEESSAAQCAAWLADSNKRAVLASLGVGTLDQALTAALPVRHQALRLLGLGRGLLIADEVHAYDPYTTQVLCGLLTFQAALGGSAVLLSATLPLATRRKLSEAFALGLGLESWDAPRAMDYPLVTRLDGRGLAEEPIARRPEAARTVPVRLVSDPGQVVQRLAAAVEAGARVAWIRNTVDDAREAWEDLSARLGPERVTLFHARYALCDRLAREQEVLKIFGEKPIPGLGGRLLVATQVAEQSLNLNFDLLATDLAPIDLILQRLGRLWRYPLPPEQRPLSRPELLVLSPEPVEDAPAHWYAALFPRARWVYQHHGQLWLTARELARRGEIAVPEQARALMEAVYGEASEEIPEALIPKEDAQKGKDMAAMSQAWMNCLSPNQAYGAAQGFWEEDTPTRLGRAQCHLRLARWESGLLTPWAEGKAQTDDPARLWELSSVAVSKGRVAAEAPIADPALRRAVEEAKAAWPGSTSERVLLIPLTPGPEGEWDGIALGKKGKEAKLSYHPQRGVAIN